MTDEVEKGLPDASVTITEVVEKLPDAAVAVAVPEIEVKQAAEEGVEAIRKQLEEANKKARQEADLRRRIEAEKASVEQAFHNEKIQRVQSDESAARNASEAAKSELEAAKRKYKEAYEAGDSEGALEAIEAISDAKDRVRQVENYIAHVERVKAAPVAPAVAHKPDPVTGTLFTPATQAWIDAHADEWADPEFRIDAQAADAKAKQRGLRADTPEYFAFVEEKLGLTTQQAVDDVVDDAPKPAVKARVTAAPTAQPQRRQVAAASAPPSRAVAGTPGVRKGEVQLTGAQREMARSFAASLPELYAGKNPDLVYAENIAKLQAERGANWAKTKGE